MTKIRVTALTADGDPYGNALVTVRLVDAGSGGAVGGGLVVAPQTAKTDGTTGIAIVDLTPTADVTPVGTYYAFTVNQSNPTVVRYIEVPAPNGTGDAEVPFDWDDPDLERLTATPPTHIPAPDSGVAGQVLGVVDPGDGPRYDLIDASGADAEPLFFDLTGLGPTYALDLSAVPDAVKSVTVYCDTAIALTITPPVRPDRLGLVVFVDGSGAITVAIAGAPLSLAGTSGLLAYLEPLPSGLGIDMQLGPSRDPAVASVNGQTGTVVLDADDIGDGTTNKAYTAAEQSKLAAITGTNTGDQTLPTLSSLGAVPTSRTLAGLDLSADRTASTLRTALGLVLGTDVVPMSYLDTDGKLAADSDSKLATQKATKSYVDVRFPIHRSATSSRRISTRGSFSPGAADGMTTTGDRVYAPIFLPAGTYNTLSIRTTTAGTSTWRLGIFNGATGDPTRPGTVLVDAGTVDTSVTAAMLTKSSLAFVVAADGWYWCCAQVETYTSAPALAVNHAANNADTSSFPGWPGQEANYLRPYTGYWDLSPSAGALTTANAITGNSSTGLDYAANVPRFWVGP